MLTQEHVERAIELTEMRSQKIEDWAPEEGLDFDGILEGTKTFYERYPQMHAMESAVAFVSGMRIGILASRIELAEEE